MSGEGRAHVVKAGETIVSIASTAGIGPQALADFNGMLVHEPLLPGQTLRVPGAGSSGPMMTHRVAKGDSLGTIARRYGVSIGELKRWNRLAGNDLRTGELIRIHKGAG
jgi:membrane-bound lytic murein transglycosylase D